MTLHFHDSIDYTGGVPDRVTRMGSQIVGILGVRKFWLVRFKNGKTRGKKSCYRKNCSAIDLIFTSRTTFRFEITIKRLYVRFMHKQKVTKLGSLKLHLPKND